MSCKWWRKWRGWLTWMSLEWRSEWWRRNEDRLTELELETFPESGRTKVEDNHSRSNIGLGNQTGIGQKWRPPNPKSREPKDAFSSLSNFFMSAIDKKKKKRIKCRDQSEKYCWAISPFGFLYISGMEHREKETRRRHRHPLIEQ